MVWPKQFLFFTSDKINCISQLVYSLSCAICHVLVYCRICKVWGTHVTEQTWLVSWISFFSWLHWYGACSGWHQYTSIVNQLSKKNVGTYTCNSTRESRDCNAVLELNTQSHVCQILNRHDNTQRTWQITHEGKYLLGQLYWQAKLFIERRGGSSSKWKIRQLAQR